MKAETTRNGAKTKSRAKTNPEPTPSKVTSRIATRARGPVMPAPSLAPIPPSVAKTKNFDGSPTSTDIQEQLRALLLAVKAVRMGDFSVRLPVIQSGLLGDISEVMNDIVEMN